MRPVFKVIQGFFRGIDLFPTSTFLRYKGDNDYTTVTGGCVSFSVIVIFVILFSSMGIRTLRKEIIASATQTEYTADPERL